MRLVMLSVLAVAALATPVAAERVTATLTFTDNDGTTARPIANARVDIYRRHLSWWNPAFAATTTTDASGRIDVQMSFAFDHEYFIQVYATNPAAKLFADPTPFLINEFSAQPGFPGTTITRLTKSPTDVHDFTFQFADAFTRPYFNVADAIQRGADYAAARRAPGETDTLGQVAVQFHTTLAASYYDPITKAIRLALGHTMNDLAVLHEYGHYLEERISSFAGIPATHSACTATIIEDVSDHGYAWMEGFADYFAAAVARSSGGVIGSGLDLENPSCPGNTKPRAQLEFFVGAALFDLIDASADGGDSFCTGSFAADTIVFQIFDKELDIGWVNPTLQHFTNAWVARGLDVPMLRRTFDTHGIVVSYPAPAPRYDMSPAANIAVFRPVGSFNSEWWIAGGPMPPTDWGRIGDVPVPADYDGDGLTDLAVWRPSDGNWFVVKSGSNVVSVQQWGAAGDIPLPGDYDGDNETDYAVYRPADQRVYIFNDGCGGNREVIIGAGTPVVGDFDGDGVDEPGIYTEVIWFIRFGAFRIQLAAGGEYGTLWSPGIPVVADYDGDSRTDFAVFNGMTNEWQWGMSSMTITESMTWGDPGGIPVPADYDGDGAVDIATWLPSTGHWSIWHDSGPVDHWWGQTGDIPVPAR